MAKMNVSPTRSNLMALEDQLATARQGYDLLEEKRQILVLELMSRLGEAKRIEKDVHEKTRAAWEVLRRAVMTLGTVNLGRLALAMRSKQELDILPNRFMGLDLPQIEARHPEGEPAYSTPEHALLVDEVTRRFQELLRATDKLAEAENALLRLAREVKKTQRRVNALEKVFIPDYNDTVEFITGTLEERERDEFVIMKMVKEKLERDRQADSPPRGDADAQATRPQTRETGS